MEQLIAMSHRYGGDGRYVLAGGGNTSVKESGVLYVKASGTRLIQRRGRRVCEDGAWKDRGHVPKTLPQEDKQRENEALRDMMDARLAGETTRPSVECMLHGLFPQTFVLHLHPALVNGLTCGDGRPKGLRSAFWRQRRLGAADQARIHAGEGLLTICLKD